MLHLSKVAFSCASVETLARRQEKRWQGGRVPVVTRFRPKRAEELLAGGSLYWIIKHQLVARQAIVELATQPRDGRTIIRLDPSLIMVRRQAMRAHQGWRYLEAAETPDDLEGEPDGIDALPPALLGKLSTLALL
jgi:hypothetical protein